MPNPRLHIVLGDQLDIASTLFDGFDDAADIIWMGETVAEATHVWCHKLRLAFFFSAMRHFRDELRRQGRTVHYRQIDDPQPTTDFTEALVADARATGAVGLVVVEPGDHRVRHMLETAAAELEIPLEVRVDSHFYDSVEDFRSFAKGRKTLILENYYRQLRKRHGILMEADGKPAGGEWNYDKQNRETFGKRAPIDVPAMPKYPLDTISKRVIETVEESFADHPGRLGHFDMPVERQDALDYLDDFIKHRLPDFGRFQDAMWEGQRFLYHSRLSALLNVKLLNPREVIEAAVSAYRTGAAPLNSVEGFVRQILGWREFVRGVYFLEGEDYLHRNELGAHEPLPSFFWDGETEMACIRDAMANVIDHGYAHHIQRLMVLGLFSLLLGADPRKFHDWHMAMYLDAVDWVSAPNTIGMSQHADGGIVGTKPYCASGNYIAKMSNHCSGCRFNPKLATGEDACPFTTLYWDFLGRHHQRFVSNRRMLFQIRNWERKDAGDREAIAEAAAALKASLR